MPTQRMGPIMVLWEGAEPAEPVTEVLPHVQGAQLERQLPLPQMLLSPWFHCRLAPSCSTGLPCGTCHRMRECESASPMTAANLLFRLLLLQPPLVIKVCFCSLPCGLYHALGFIGRVVGGRRHS